MIRQIDSGKDYVVGLSFTSVMLSKRFNIVLEDHSCAFGCDYGSVPSLTNDKVALA